MSFNIRVYGILIRDKKDVLVTDEEIHDLSFTKFPGGGLEFGEGLTDCLKREFLEELQLPIVINELCYLTEHFQQSAFIENEQVISIYYYVEASKNNLDEFQKRYGQIYVNEKPHWIPIIELKEIDFMFPIDKIVANKIYDVFT